MSRSPLHNLGLLAPHLDRDTLNLKGLVCGVKLKIVPQVREQHLNVVEGGGHNKSMPRLKSGKSRRILNRMEIPMTVSEIRVL